jgi:hypothetical protein
VKENFKLLANLAVVARDNHALSSEPAMSAFAIIRTADVKVAAELLKAAIDIF